MNLRKQPSVTEESDDGYSTKAVKGVADILRDKGIEEIYLSFLGYIKENIKDIFLNKEYYPNLQDGSNPKIDEMGKLSPYGIGKRLKEKKGIFYMRSCIPQTLYSIDKIKEKFPELINFMNLSAEIYRDKEINILGAHFFILINVPNRRPLIIDYAHDNDVYIYSGEYSNKSEHVKAETLDFISMPATAFNEKDSIITIIETAKKSNKLENLGFNPLDILFNNENLKKDNTLKNFEEWLENQGSKIVVHWDVQY